MLKTVSSIVNAIGALNYKGTWNASTNTPALASGVGVKGDYYVVSVAGATTLDGISNWGVGDWATFNGSAWQRVEGGTGSGSVLQVVNGSASTVVTTTGDDILTVPITPVRTSSKILMIGNCNIQFNAISNAAGFLRFRKNASDMIIGGVAIQAETLFTTATNAIVPHCLHYLDSPNTTSAINYGLRIGRSSTGTTSLTTVGIYSLTLMEIAG